ncbi:uncharacterized protein A4U43_C04F18840 [Asparagus officinalis]|uniref:Uncharacterized protein n=1 Tax=Asparagus officinalis TaxID=4686 RepID=A0A5P1F3S9_ASPOF|nr:uncharacterized protein LOC109837564 [Asparagus officinalis]ONK72383.1 uncharacterized protein A4U43_C04F18840 [Asparagus officinalis]
MVKLFLSPPVYSDLGNEGTAKERISLLQNLESIIGRVIKSGGRYEARIWLCNSISSIHTIDPRDQCGLFVDILRSKNSKQDVAPRVLQMVFEKRPEKVGPIIAKQSYMLEKFFKGNQKRILQWFDNFATTSESGHKKGARALSQFAFVNRDICWEELEWKGKHGQSPAVVATKPHYFYDLDVLKTVENFLEYVPDFWLSDELAESVKDGDILNLDVKYFVDKFIQLMYEEKLDDIWTVIEDFLEEIEFSFLSQNLLILLDESSLLTFLKSLGRLIRLNVKCKEYGYPSCWLENLLSKCNDFMSLDDFLLLNAVVSHGRQLLRVLGDEDHEEEKGNLEDLLRNAVVCSDADHWALMKECADMKEQVAIKWAGLQSWIIHYYLSKECRTQQSCESLFVENGISFRKSDEYSLVNSDGFSMLYSSNSDGEGVARKGGVKKRKRDRKKKRRKRYASEDNKAEELVEFEMFGGWQGLQSGGSSWFLSTDGFSCAWNTADLAEHLSRHCFSTWMKWVSSN